MFRKMLLLLVPLVYFCPGISHGSLSDPSNYDECIVGSMRGVSSDVAAGAIIESCRNLFPEEQTVATPPPAPTPVPPPVAAPTPAPSAAVAVSTQIPKAAAPVPPVPVDTTDARNLTADELARLSFKAKVFGSTYRVTIDNENSNLTLTEVTIAVWDEGDSRSSRREYSEMVQIEPQTAAMVKYTVHYSGDETGWRWDVVAARGVE